MARLGRAQPFPPITRHEQSLAAPVTQQKTVSDTLSLNEVFLKQIQKVRAETVSLSESFTKSVKKAYAETVSLTEPGFTAIKKILVALPETVALTEAQVLKVGKVMAETVALSETNLLKTGKAFAETVVLSEAFQASKKFTASLVDTLGATELFTKLLKRTQAETVSLTEELDTVYTPAAGGGSNWLTNYNKRIMPRHRPVGLYL